MEPDEYEPEALFGDDFGVDADFDDSRDYDIPTNFDEGY